MATAQQTWQIRYAERQSRIKKYGLDWKIRIAAVWRPFDGRGKFWPVDGFTPTALIRDAFATWRASEDALAEIRARVAELRTTRKRAPKRAARPAADAPPAKRRRKIER